MAKSFITSDQIIPLTSATVTGADIYNKTKAALIESGATVYDEWVDASNIQYLILRETFGGTYSVPIYWGIKVTQAASPNISVDGMYLGWNTTTHVGSNKIVNTTLASTSYSISTASTGTPTSLTISVVSGSRHRFIRIGYMDINNTNAYACPLFGVEAYQDTPPGWDNSIYPFVTMIGTGSVVANSSACYTRQRTFGASKQTVPPQTFSYTGFSYTIPPFMPPSNTITGNKFIANNLMMMTPEGYQIRGSPDFYYSSALGAGLFYRDIIVVTSGVEEYMILTSQNSSTGSEIIRVV